jgi:hypothetical protein
MRLSLLGHDRFHEEQLALASRPIAGSRPVYRWILVLYHDE